MFAPTDLAKGSFRSEMAQSGMLGIGSVQGAESATTCFEVF